MKFDEDTFWGFTCDHCGKLVQKWKLRNTGEGDDLICLDCYEELSDEEKEEYGD